VDMALAGEPLGPFRRSLDLWSDGSLVLVSLPGHTCGQLGLMVNLPGQRQYFFIGDAAWVEENYLEMNPPAYIVGAIWSSRDDAMESMRSIRDYAKDNPDTVIIPSHCPKAWKRLQQLGVAR